MNRTQIATLASIPLFSCFASGCELVLGDLPASSDELTTAAGTTSAGGASTSASTSAMSGQGGNGGAATTGSTASSGATTVTSSSGQGGCCDCDGDGDPAEGAVCNGGDCNDGNGDIHTGETIYYAEKTPANDFDWDCNGTAERDPALLSTVDCGVVGLPCNQKEGFLGTTVPACGETADWGTCVGNIIPCTAQVIVADRPMKCR